MSSEKLASIESDVADIRKGLERGNRITLIVGVIAILLMLAYFVYGYSEINSVLKPRTIVDLSQTMLDDNLPEFKKSIKSGVENNAPKWAASLSQQAVASVPTLRQELVDYSVEKTDEIITQTISLNEKQFDEFIANNRENITQAMTELETNEDVSAELLEVIQNGFNDVLKADLERDSEEILAYADLMNQKMARLKSNKKLDESEKLERQALMILRRLQLSQLKE